MKKLILILLIIFIGLPIIAGILLFVGMSVQGLNTAKEINNDTTRKDLLNQFNIAYQNYVASKGNVYPEDGYTDPHPLIGNLITPKNCKGETNASQITSITVGDQCIGLEGLKFTDGNIGACNSGSHFTSTGVDTFDLCYNKPTGSTGYQLGVLLGDKSNSPYIITQGN